VSAGGLGEAIAERLAAVDARVRQACERAGRAREEVRILAVSKRHPPGAIRAAYAAGQRDFGENYVQELDEKAAALADLDGLRLRFIGHLQRNKARVLVRRGCSVDTVDSERLALELDRLATREGRRVEVLLQVNIDREAQKAGIDPDQVPGLCARVAQLPGLELRGLMAIPAPAEEPEAMRPAFRRLAQLGQQLGLPELSMGMSDDLEVAVEEGATMVRVGTAIFGPRS